MTTPILLTQSLHAQECEPEWLPPIPGPDAIIRAMTVWDPDGDGPQEELLIIGGQFQQVGTVRASCIAAWDGETWKALGQGLTNGVWALDVFNGDLIAGGTFSHAGGLPSRGVARWDGKKWHAMPIDTGILTVATYDDSLFAAGLSNGNGCMFEWTGESWVRFDENIKCGIARVLCEYKGELVLGGNVGSSPTVFDGITRWNGKDWLPLGLGMDNEVRALLVYKDELIAGGMFSQAGAMAAKGIASWNGIEWQDIGGSIVTSGSFAVRSLLQFNGDLVVAGSFQNIGNSAANNIARWDGEQWHPLGIGVSSGVSATAVFQDHLYVGGDFLSAGRMPAVRIARWGCFDPILGDITGDGVVGVPDLLAIINNWGTCPVPPQACDADIAPVPNGDGAVGVADLLMVIANWSE